MDEVIVEWGHRYRRTPSDPWHFIINTSKKRALWDVADLLAAQLQGEAHVMCRTVRTITEDWVDWTPEPVADEDVEAWLDSLDPEVAPSFDASALRAISLAAADADAGASRRLREAVALAVAHNRTWAQIGMMLGLSGAAAQQWFEGATVISTLSQSKEASS